MEPIQNIPMNNIHQKQSVPTYMENEGVGLAEFKEFVDYWMQNRNSRFNETYQDPETSTIHQIIRNNFIPLESEEEIPPIIFTKNHESVVINHGIALPRLTMARAGKLSFDGRRMEPLFNLSQKIERYYKDGLETGNLGDIHKFVIDLHFAFVNDFEIITYMSDGKRNFVFVNNACEDNNFYYV